MFKPLCGAVMAEGEITSQNIVGYAQNSLTDGSVGVGTQFFAVNGDGIALSNVVVNAADLYSIDFQTLSYGGETLHHNTWNDWTEDPLNPGEFLPGFWEEDWSGTPTSFVVTPGVGVWVQGAAGDSIQTAGQVGQSDIIISAWEQAGNKLVCNSFPLPVALEDLVVTTGDMYSIDFQTLTPGGETEHHYTWNDWTEDPLNPGEFLPGFWEEDWSGEKTNFKIQPGQSVWLQASEGDTVRIPAPEL